MAQQVTFESNHLTIGLLTRQMLHYLKTAIQGQSDSPTKCLPYLSVISTTDFPDGIYECRLFDADVNLI